jgi:hypothetical protein
MKTHLRGIPNSTTSMTRVSCVNQRPNPRKQLEPEARPFPAAGLDIASPPDSAEPVYLFMVMRPSIAGLMLDTELRYEITACSSGTSPPRTFLAFFSMVYPSPPPSM